MSGNRDSLRVTVGWWMMGFVVRGTGGRLSFPGLLKNGQSLRNSLVVCDWLLKLDLRFYIDSPGNRVLLPFRTGRSQPSADDQAQILLAVQRI